MNQREINELNIMRLSGHGPAAIAKELSLPLNTIRSYIRRHPVKQSGIVCKQCGRPIVTLPGKKAKQFCSDHCRSQWWNKHRGNANSRNLVSFTCKYCGKEFRDYEKAKRKYCSRECYHKALGKRTADSV